MDQPRRFRRRLIGTAITLSVLLLVLRATANWAWVASASGAGAAWSVLWNWAAYLAVAAVISTAVGLVWRRSITVGLRTLCALVAVAVVVTGSVAVRNRWGTSVAALYERHAVGVVGDAMDLVYRSNDSLRRFRDSGRERSAGLDSVAAIDARILLARAALSDLELSDNAVMRIDEEIVRRLAAEEISTSLTQEVIKYSRQQINLSTDSESVRRSLHWAPRIP